MLVYSHKYTAYYHNRVKWVDYWAHIAGSICIHRSSSDNHVAGSFCNHGSLSDYISVWLNVKRVVISSNVNLIRVNAKKRSDRTCLSIICLILDFK